MGLGDHDKALQYLQMDYEEGGQGLFFWNLNNDIKFDPIREEKGFQDLLLKIC